MIRAEIVEAPAGRGKRKARTGAGKSFNWSAIGLPALAQKAAAPDNADDYEESMRVVGGNPAESKAWPWQIAFFQRRASDGRNWTAK